MNSSLIVVLHVSISFLGFSQPSSHVANLVCKFVCLFFFLSLLVFICLLYFNATCSYCEISIVVVFFAYLRCKIIAIICNVLKNVLRYKFVTSKRVKTIHTILDIAKSKRKRISREIVNANKCLQNYQLVITDICKQPTKTHDYVLFIHKHSFTGS